MSIFAYSGPSGDQYEAFKKKYLEDEAAKAEAEAKAASKDKATTK